MNQVNVEFTNMLTAVRIAESANMLRDQVTAALFRAPAGILLKNRFPPMVTAALFRAPAGMETIQTASKVQGADQSHLTGVRHADAPV